MTTDNDDLWDRNHMDEKSVLRAADAVATTGADPNARGRILATLRTEMATNIGETAPPPDREIVDIGVHLSPSVIAAMERAAAAFDEPPDGPKLSPNPPKEGVGSAS